MKHDIHKVRVEALDFSFDSTFLFSLGGRDDGNVVVTHIPSLEPMCGRLFFVQCLVFTMLYIQIIMFTKFFLVSLKYE